MDKKIKVLVVDDSLLMQKVMSMGLSADNSINVIGFAIDPFMARDKILSLEPDVIVLDINMPKMNGIDFLKKLMPQYPVRVVVVSSEPSRESEALKAGAIDFVSKTGAADIDSFIKELIAKVKTASLANLSKYTNKDDLDKTSKIDNNNKIIAIGASTGGTEATAKILKGLKGDLPGILIVQHMPAGFTKMYADRLNNQSDFEVKEAADNDKIFPGRVLVAAGEYQMKLVKNNGVYCVKSYKGERVNSHCPSIDVLFYSVAEICKKNAMGIILTGMGNDGANGLLKMKQNGAYTVGQDEKTCVVYGMPMVANKIGALTEQSALENIPKLINKWAHQTR